MTVLYILLGLLGWFSCGLLAVFLAGLLHRFDLKDSQDCESLIWWGPLGLVLALLVGIVSFLYKYFNLLTKASLWAKSMGEGKK